MFFYSEYILKPGQLVASLCWTNAFESRPRQSLINSRLLLLPPRSANNKPCCSGLMSRSCWFKYDCCCTFLKWQFPCPNFKVFGLDITSMSTDNYILINILAATWRLTNILNNGGSLLNTSGPPFFLARWSFLRACILILFVSSTHPKRLHPNCRMMSCLLKKAYCFPESLCSRCLTAAGSEVEWGGRSHTAP